MCTVTLTPSDRTEKGFFLTSNRDEFVGRKTLPPSMHIERGVKLLYPRDTVAGGTWIGLSEKDRAICLLNGSFEKHDRNPPYRMSRGVVVKDFLIADDTDVVIKDYVLWEIEPFTMILVDWNERLRFVELVWDGSKKHVKELELKPRIWSSSPLYTPEMKQLREEWYTAFQQEKELTAGNLLEFHHSAGTGDANTDVVMNRGLSQTQSITQIVHLGEEVRMFYKELKSGKASEFVFEPFL